MIVTFECYYQKPGEPTAKWHVVSSGHMRRKQALKKGKLMVLRHGNPVRLWKEGKTGMTLMKELYPTED